MATLFCSHFERSLHSGIFCAAIPGNSVGDISLSESTIVWLDFFISSSLYVLFPLLLLDHIFIFVYIFMCGYWELVT